MDKLKILKNLNLLYVEDEDSLRESISTGLGLFISNITTACNGEEGLEKFKDGNFDIVISDIKMPKMDGVKMVQSIKQLSPLTPVIFTTAFTDTKYLIESIELGVSSYVLKPIDIKILLNNLYVSYLPIYQKNKLVKQQKIIDDNLKSSAILKVLSAISHQWNQPLAKISLISSKLKIKSELDSLSKDELSKELSSIEKTSTKLSSMINKMKIYFNNTPVSQNISTCNVIDNALDFFNTTFKENNIVVKRECLHDEKLQLNQEMFLQLVMHIISNCSEQFNLNPNIENKSINFISKIDNNNYMLSIEDNAGGIDSKIVGDMFDIYTSTKGLNERGLGLYYSKLIVSNHFNGSIIGENTINKNNLGAKFTITIPLIAIQG